MVFPIISGAIPSAPIEESAIPSVPIGNGAFPTTSFDLPPAYTASPTTYSIPLHPNPIPIDACDLERNCYDRCYSESSCHSSEYRHHRPNYLNLPADKRDSGNKCVAVVCVLLLFMIIVGIIVMILTGVFDNMP